MIRYFFIFCCFISPFILAYETSSRKSVNITLNHETVSIMEGGKFSIDIRRFPLPKKSDAMNDFLCHEASGIPAERGMYFGNQNQSKEDRDAAMVEIPGLTVYGVDEKQENIIDGVIPIGAGIEATQNKLREILDLPVEQRPLFIGFDVDDTVLGLRKDKTKEDLLLDRKKLAELIVTLALDDVQIVFFSDGGSQITLNRIGYPLLQLIQKNEKYKPVSMLFYVSGMVTKLRMTGEMLVYDEKYNAQHRLNSENVGLLQKAIGNVYEDETGIMFGNGILGTYYFNELTEEGKNGLQIRNTAFHPEFVAHYSAKGNVMPPNVDIRDFDAEKNDASMIAITGLPSTYRPILIESIAKQLAE